MPGSRRRNLVTVRAGALLAIGFLLSSVVGTGCESAPIRAIEGARHYSAGTQALNQGRGQEAIVKLERAADLVPHASEVQNHLGLAYWSDGRERAARVAFEKALELDCENAAARKNLDRLMLSMGVATEPKLEAVTLEVEEPGKPSSYVGG